MRIIVHVGLARTATTFLQNEVFSRHSQVLYLGKFNHSKREARRWVHADVFHWWKWLKNPGPTAEFPDAGETWKRVFTDLRTGGEKCVAVLSDERLTKPSPPGRDTRRERVARRIRQSLRSEVGIMLTIRDQFTAVPSLYGRYLEAAKNSGSLKTFDDWFNERSERIYDRHDLSSVYAIYADLFGAENVHVFCYEDMVRSHQVWRKNLYQFLGVPDPSAELGQKVGPSPAKRDLVDIIYLGKVAPFLRGPALALRKFCNPCFHSLARRSVDLAPYGPNERHLDTIRTMFARSNSDFANRSGIDLAARGYPG